MYLQHDGFLLFHGLSKIQDLCGPQSKTSLKKQIIQDMGMANAVE
jgi:hypothetical protein